MKANITVYSKQVHVTQVACQCINNMHYNIIHSLGYLAIIIIIHWLNKEYTHIHKMLW